jgi:rod shape-determining protein MreC
MRQRNRFFIFISVIALTFALLTYQGIEREEGISLPFTHPVYLLSGIYSHITGKVEDFFERYVFIIGKVDENRRLIERIRVIEQERNRYIEAEAENRRLRRLLALKTKNPHFVTAAEVIARDPGNWFHLLWIDKGLNDGIKKDMIAVSPDGLVGRVRDVLDERASIMLITDVNSAVAVRIQQSRVDGILEGRGDRMTFLKYIPRDVEVEQGQRVITSGLDGIYPEGILVGYINSIRKEGESFFQEITVRPAQDLNRVEEIAILRR